MAVKSALVLAGLDLPEMDCVFVLVAAVSGKSVGTVGREGRSSTLKEGQQAASGAMSARP
jgi:hypothetical protein